MTEPSRLDETEARVWRAYLDTQRDLQAALSRILTRDAGLTGAEYELLVPISEAPCGLIRARDLGRLINWERSRLSHQISRMEKRGLVVKEECSEDARGAMVRLTECGRAAMRAAAPGHVAAVRQYFMDVLTPEEVAMLDSLLRRVHAGLPKGQD